MKTSPQSAAPVMSSEIEWSIQYDGVCSLYTHPRQLAALMIKCGLHPPPVERARILELGCATGGNLTPIASSLPESTCVGIDPFEEQITNARERAASAQITNVTYLPIGVSDLDQLDGPFDYIIAHGLFSWITDEHRHDTLKLCYELLSPQGVAYLSYNTYPHWHFEQTTRSLLRWQHKLLTRGASDAERGDPQLVDRARELLSVYARYAHSSPPNSLRETYKSSHSRLHHLPDWYLVHEYLLENNRAFYFNEWMGMARDAGLAYVGDAAENTELTAQSIPSLLQREVSLLTDDPIESLQGIDLLVNRGLRRSVVMRAQDLSAASRHIQHEQPIHRRLNPWTISELLEGDYGDDLYIATSYRPEGVITELSRTSTYQDRIAAHPKLIQTASPTENALLLLLSSAWPQQISLRETLHQAEALLREFGLWGSASHRELSDALHKLLCRDIISHPTWGVMSDNETSADVASRLPELYPCVRATAELAWPQSFTNAHHTSSFPSEASHWLITQLCELTSIEELKAQHNASRFSSTPLESLFAELRALALAR